MSAEEIRTQIEKLCNDEAWTKTFMLKVKKNRNGCWEWQGGLETPRDRHRKKLLRTQNDVYDPQRIHYARRINIASVPQ